MKRKYVVRVSSAKGEIAETGKKSTKKGGATSQMGRVIEKFPCRAVLGGGGREKRTKKSSIEAQTVSPENNGGGMPTL